MYYWTLTLPDGSVINSFTSDRGYILAVALKYWTEAGGVGLPPVWIRSFAEVEHRSRWVIPEREDDL